MSFFKDDKDNNPFRCKIGRDFLVIDMAGDIYECDEYVGEKRKAIGNIKTGINYDNYQASHTELFEDCKYCDISNLCLGRCRKCLESYEEEQIRNYCSLTKALVKVIIKNIGEIKEYIELKKISPKTIYERPYYNFEEIP